MTDSLVQCTTPILQYPVKFLGATVLSCNSQMGWGVDTSTLDAELVEDCVAQSGYDATTEQIIPFDVDSFVGKLVSPELIGSAAYFSLPAPDPAFPENKFRFGGVVTNWTTKLSSSGLTYSVKLSDPRIVLENTVVVVDSYSNLPFQHINYYNVYAAYEAGVHYGNCSVFGEADSTERGMVFSNIIKGLLSLGKLAGDNNYRPTVYSSTTNTVGYGGLFKLDLGWTLSTDDIYTATLVQSRPDAVPLGPEFYRISGNMSILELINNICELTGRTFYATLIRDPSTLENTIVVSCIQLTQSLFSGVNTIVNTFTGYATDLSYGKELRNDKTRKLIFGDQIRYLTSTTAFTPFFGENELGEPIIPIENEDGIFTEPDGQTISDCGFWINVDIRSLNVTLNHKIGVTGEDSENLSPPINSVWISEIDIRSALSGYELWRTRTLAQGSPYANINGSLVKILQESNEYKDILDGFVKAIQDTWNSLNFNIQGLQSRQPIQDFLLKASRNVVQQGNNKIFQDLENIHKFIQNLGNTYYGKQFLTRLDNTICATINNEAAGDKGFGEKIYSEIPTNEGGWVDYNIPVLGLMDPALNIFRKDDDKIGAFARFDSATSTGAIGQNINATTPTTIEDPPSAPTPPT